MTKGQMKEVLEKVDALEKILMRDLEEREIEYLKDHTIDDFIYDVLGFDKEDLLVLKKIKKIISDWCTRPEEELDSIREDANLFFESGEFENENNDINFFRETTNRINRKISNILSNILEDLENEKRNFVSKEDGSNKLEITSNCENSSGFEFNESDAVEGCDEIITDEHIVSLEDVIPESAKKWITNLSQREILDAIDEATKVLAEEYSKKESNPESILDDEIISEIVDQIKNVAIKHYVSIIQKEGEYEFLDSEIQSEVLDYLYKHNYKVKSINNIVSLV